MPTPALVTTATTNLAGASLDNPITEFQVFARGTVVTVELSLNDADGNIDQVGEYYVIPAQDVRQGVTCPPPGAGDAIRMENNTASTTVTIERIDTVISLCVDNLLVARSYYIFKM